MPAAGAEGKSLLLPHVGSGAGTVGRKQLWGWDLPISPSVYPITSTAVSVWEPFPVKPQKWFCRQESISQPVVWQHAVPLLGVGGDGWGCTHTGYSLFLQAKRKLDLEGPELHTPKGKGRTLVQVPSPRSKFGALEGNGRGVG